MLWPARLPMSLVTVCAAVGLATAPAPARAEGMQGMDANTLQRVLPAVVSITILKVRPTQEGSDQASAVRVHLVGSGFIIDSSGIIVTNKHVIEGAQSITVGLMDKRRLPARLIAAGRQIDLALVKVDAGRPLPVLTFGDSDQLRIGDPVLAIGNPLGVGMSVSSGIVSALNRDIMDSPYDDYIQTDAAINHGNSGGPLVDKEGRVIGVDTAIYSSHGNTGSIGLGFAIPSRVVQPTVRHLLDPEHVPLGWLGLRVQDVTPDIADAIGLRSVTGALVTDVDASSSAAKAGIREGDVVLKYGEKNINDSRELTRLVVSSQIGQTVPIVIWRKQQEVTLSATVGKAPTDIGMPITPPPATGPGNMMVSYGIHVSPTTDSEVRESDLPAKQRGVLVTSVEANSLAADDGVLPGDVIVKVGEEAVSGPADLRANFEKIKAQGRRFALMLVRGKNGLRWVPVPLDATQ